MERVFKHFKTLQRMKQGPLGPYVASYSAQLRAEGYARQSGRLKIRLIAGFSRWLERKGIAAAEVGVQQTADYLRCRKKRRNTRRRGDAAALVRLLKLLRDQGRSAEQVPAATYTPVESLVREFDLYLQNDRALAVATRINYRPFVQQCLTVRFGSGPVDLSSLRAADVIGFVRCQAGQLKGKRAQLLTTALRSFLRFARYRGDITLDLAASVPAVASGSLSTLPRFLPPAQVKQVLASCDRQTVVGRRDYAILLLLARLGLRAGEVAHLTLEDVDWETGCIAVQGKSGRSSQLPLPVDVGEAIAAYLRNGRPRVPLNRRLFLRVRAPVDSFRSQEAVISVVRHALVRAGIDSPWKGAHQFRHTLATEMLRQGASLSEIGEVLRHQSPQTTAIYAKVDLASLRTLALTWPGGGR